jgi:hypothetical protein
MRRSYVVPMRWMVMYEYEVPGWVLNLSFTELPRPWSPWESSPSMKNPHGGTGNRTRDLMITRPRGWSGCKCNRTENSASQWRVTFLCIPLGDHEKSKRGQSYYSVQISRFVVPWICCRLRNEHSTFIKTGYILRVTVSLSAKTTTWDPFISWLRWMKWICTRMSL